ncbi:MAG: hypothetical protein HeimAB125_19380 [Candidatus Heimdallarchaeota archaeon AB_125]|nr:MAG: hypothetical protein HeimAB125_19380 [Candidatus Heimdallarchaeota archaeon AB_125]
MLCKKQPHLISESSKQSHFDGVIGNFTENFHLTSSIVNFALKRANDRFTHESLLDDYKQLFDTTPIGFFRSTEDGKLILLNPAMIKMFRFDSEKEMKSLQIRDLYFDPERRKLVLDNFRNKGYYHSQQERMKRKNGELFWVSMQARAIYDNNGNFEYYEGSIIDISKQKKLEDEIKQSENQYRKLFENTGTGVCVVNEDFIIVLCNKRFEEITGYIKQDIENKLKWTDFIPKEEMKKLCKLSDQLRDESGILPNRFETNLIDKTGEERNILVFVDFLPEKKQSVSSIIDITDLKLIESELIESELKYRGFVQNFDGIAYRGNIDFTPIFFHGKTEEITGYTEEEFISGYIQWDKLILEDDLDKLNSSFTQIAEVPNFHDTREYRIKTKDQKIKWLREHIMNIIDQNGVITGVQGTLRDISTQKQTEKELINAINQIEKNLEQFTVLVDSIRNPLAVIVGLVDYYGEEEKEIVIKHANLIDDIIKHIEERTAESEEVRKFMLKYFY